MECLYYISWLILVWSKLVGSLPMKVDSDKDIRAEYLYGRNKEDYKYVVNNLQNLKEQSFQKHGVPSKHSLQETDDLLWGLMDDIILTSQDVEVLSRASNIEDISKRMKRNIMNFELYPDKKWTLPIPFFIDTTTITDSSYQELMRRAFQQWEEKTCVTFQELTSVEGVTDQYLFVHGDTNRCSSFLGKQDVNVAFPQYINMNYPECFSLIGTAIHEIGHALGIHHEHQRPDRDEFVTIVWDNILESQQFSFEKKSVPDVSTNIDPYSYESVMHYGALHFSKDETAKKYSIEPKNWDFLSVMGQSSELSFYDAKLINDAYCSDKCSTEISCQNGGYQDPKNCNQCLCQGHWTGTLCDVINHGSSDCGPFTGSRVHTSADEDFTFFLNSPTSVNGQFVPGDKCYWSIKVPDNMFIKMWFGTPFGLYLTASETCIFWVEIRNPSETISKRYCGYYTEEIPFPPFYSETNEAVVLFQSFSDIEATPLAEGLLSTLGFKLYYTFSTCGSADCDQIRPCECRMFLNDNQEIHDDLCVTSSWCRNNGYPDPNNCGQCICPEGWTGTYCTEITKVNSCPNTITCYNGGHQDPSNCNRCICPVERSTADNCRSVAEGFGDCSLGSGSYVASEIGALYLLSSTSFIKGSTCFWQMSSPENTYMEFTIFRTFGLYKSTSGRCIFWLEIFDPTLDVDTDGRRFCGNQFSTSPDTYQTKGNVAFIVFKSFDVDFPDDSIANMGFRMHFKAKNKSNEMTTTTVASQTSKTPVIDLTSQLPISTNAPQTSKTPIVTQTSQLPISTNQQSSKTPVPENTSQPTRPTEVTSDIESSRTTVGSQHTSVPPVIVASGAINSLPNTIAIFIFLLFHLYL